ncbi:MAG: hypothetical protein JW741_08210 [Sedimentisphaerales bacterium]|nr:hypothetical protein [Sedimentisphaerales bacterium]
METPEYITGEIMCCACNCSTAGCKCDCNCDCSNQSGSAHVSHGATGGHPNTVNVTVALDTTSR